MNLATLLKILLATAEEIIPIFIHNPQTQKVEAVVLSTANAVMLSLPPVPAPTTPVVTSGNVTTVTSAVTGGTV